MEIKGTAVIAIRDFIKLNFPDKYKTWVESLPEDSKAIFGGLIDASKWYPLKAGGIDSTRKLADMFYDGNYVKGAWESGSFSAQKALTGIYKIFVKASTPNYIIQRASRVFATYYQPCKMEIIETSDSHVILQITDMTESDIVIENRIGGWIEKALLISGASEVNVDFSNSIARGDDATTINISWN